MMDPLHALQRAVERHRLMFLYFSEACRFNSRAAWSPTGVHERIFRDEIPGWRAMVASIDPAGEFLVAHQSVLERYAQAAVARFGPGVGNGASDTPGLNSGQPDDGGPPYWMIETHGASDLDRSSDAVLDACRAVAGAGHGDAVLDAVRAATAAARPENAPKWYPDVATPWRYLSTLDDAIGKIKIARVEANIPIAPALRAFLDAGTPSGVLQGSVRGESSKDHIEKVRLLLAALVEVDVVIISLGRKLSASALQRRSHVNQENTADAQLRLREWIEPIMPLLNAAERACVGVASAIGGIIESPERWETEIRLEIGALRDHLVGLELSAGHPTDEALVVSAASSLHGRGRQLEAAIETLLATSALSGSSVDEPSHTHSRGAPANLTTVPRLVLGEAGDPCVVLGNKKPPLTDGQRAVVVALLEAGEEGLTKDAIEAVRASARRMLEDLRRDPDWKAVILMPGQTNGRYRVRG
jgi:hypothetical protein